MITIKYDTKDPRVTSGIKHFLLTSGLYSHENSNEKSPVEISYGRKSKTSKKFNIQIREGPDDFSEKVEGYIHFKTGKIPVFEVIHPLESEGEILATYVSEEGNYPCATLNKNKITINFDVLAWIHGRGGAYTPGFH